MSAKDEFQSDMGNPISDFGLEAAEAAGWMEWSSEKRAELRGEAFHRPAPDLPTAEPRFRLPGLVVWLPEPPLPQGLGWIDRISDRGVEILCRGSLAFVGGVFGACAVWKLAQALAAAGRAWGVAP